MTIQIPLTHNLLWNYRAYPGLIFSPEGDWKDQDQMDWQKSLLEYPGPRTPITVCLDEVESGRTPAMFQKREDVRNRQKVLWKRPAMI